MFLAKLGKSSYLGHMTTQRNESIPAWTQGDRLRKARAVTGLTTRDFADKIGVSQVTVTNAENDKTKVRRITLNAWSLATGVPIEWLMFGVESGYDDGGGSSTLSRSYRPLQSVAA